MPVAAATGQDNDTPTGPHPDALYTEAPPVAVHADHVRTYTRPRLRAENRGLQHKVHKLAGSNAGGGATAGGAASPQLEAIASCESSGDAASVGGGGAFRRKYQFTYGTWASVGGSATPPRRRRPSRTSAPDAAVEVGHVAVAGLRPVTA